MSSELTTITTLHGIQSIGDFKAYQTLKFNIFIVPTVVVPPIPYKNYVYSSSFLLKKKKLQVM